MAGRKPKLSLFRDRRTSDSWTCHNNNNNNLNLRSSPSEKDKDSFSSDIDSPGPSPRSYNIKNSSQDKKEDFDLVPLPERDDRFWYSANDLALSHLASQPSPSNPLNASEGAIPPELNPNIQSIGPRVVSSSTSSASDASTTISREKRIAKALLHLHIQAAEAATASRKKNPENIYDSTKSHQQTQQKRVRKKSRNAVATVNTPPISSESSFVNKEKKSKHDRKNSNPILIHYTHNELEEKRDQTSTSSKAKSKHFNFIKKPQRGRSLSLPEKIWNDFLSNSGPPTNETASSRKISLDRKQAHFLQEQLRKSSRKLFGNMEVSSEENCGNSQGGETYDVKSPSTKICKKNVNSKAPELNSASKKIEKKSKSNGVGKIAVRKTDVKNASKSSDATSASKNAEAKSASKNSDTKPASKNSEAKLPLKNAETKQKKKTQGKLASAEADYSNNQIDAKNSEVNSPARIPLSKNVGTLKKRKSSKESHISYANEADKVTIVPLRNAPTSSAVTERKEEEVDDTNRVRRTSKWKLFTNAFRISKKSSHSGNTDADSKSPRDHVILANMTCSDPETKRSHRSSKPKRPVTFHGISSSVEQTNIKRLSASLTDPSLYRPMHRDEVTPISDDDTKELNRFVRKSSGNFLKSFRIKKRNKVESASDSVIDASSAKRQTSAVSIDDAEDNRGNRTKELAGKGKHRRSSSGNIFQAFYSPRRRRESSVTARDFDDVTLDLASGELKKTWDGTVIANATGTDVDIVAGFPLLTSVKVMGPDIQANTHNDTRSHHHRRHMVMARHSSPTSSSSHQTLGSKGSKSESTRRRRLATALNQYPPDLYAQPATVHKNPSTEELSIIPSSSALVSQQLQNFENPTRKHSQSPSDRECQSRGSQTDIHISSQHQEDYENEDLQLHSPTSNSRGLLGRVKDFHRNSVFNFGSSSGTSPSSLGNKARSKNSSRSNSRSANHTPGRNSSCSSSSDFYRRPSAPNPLGQDQPTDSPQSQRLGSEENSEWRKSDRNASRKTSGLASVSRSEDHQDLRCEEEEEEEKQSGSLQSRRNSSEEELRSINNVCGGKSKASLGTTTAVTMTLPRHGGRQAGNALLSSSLSDCEVSDQSKDNEYDGPFVGKALALVDCISSPYDRHALRYKKGDVIEIISKKPTGTWTGKVHGKVGHFKFINVQVLPEDDEDDVFPSGPDDFEGDYSRDEDYYYNNCTRFGDRSDASLPRRRRRKHSLTPWEIEQRQSVASVINGLRKENALLRKSSEMRSLEVQGSCYSDDGPQGPSSMPPSWGQSFGENTCNMKGFPQVRRTSSREGKLKKEKKGRPKSVRDLLERINLGNYISVFILHGFESLDLFKELEEEDLDRLAIVEGADRAKILTAAELLREYDTEEEIPIAQSIFAQAPPPPPPAFSNHPRDSGIFVKFEEELENQPSGNVETILNQSAALQRGNSNCTEKDNQEIILSPATLQQLHDENGFRNFLNESARATRTDFINTATTTDLTVENGVEAKTDFYGDVKQRFLNARSMFEMASNGGAMNNGGILNLNIGGNSNSNSGGNQSPNLNSGTNSKSQENLATKNRFVYEKSDSGISCSTNSPTLVPSD